MKIKDAETIQLIRDLCELTHESHEVAILEAVRERLLTLRRTKPQRLSDRLLQIGRDCARRLREPYRSAPHGELLYGERGLSD
jgi:antitoxin VapB